MKKRIISFFTALSMTLMLFTGIPISVSAGKASETCEHRYVGYGGPMNPTCTERGIKRYYVHCMDCNRYFAKETSSLYETWGEEITEDDVYIPALGHDFSVDWAKNATHHWHKCIRKNCNEVDEESRAEHSGGTATCKEKAVCEVCGREYGEKGDHIYTTWSTNDSYHWHACLLCGAKKDNASHSGGTATCTKKKVCDTCGQEYGYLAAHNYGDYKNNDTQHWQVCLNPDCGNIKNLTDHNFVWKKDETGHWHECSVCGYKKDDKESHNIVLWEGREPTCKQIGFTDGLRCSECYYVEKARERLDKTDHTWGDWVVTTPATEETEGEKKHTCSGCDTVETETIPVTGHTFSDKWTSDETHHWHAATCGHDVKSDEAEHDWNDGIVTKDPTEEAEGVKTYTCTTCQKTRTESIDKLTHTHTLTAHDAVPATCTTDGNEAYWTCSGCNKMFSDGSGTTEIDSIPVIPAAGHKYEWKSDANEHWHECTVCGDKKDNASHIWNDGIVTTEPDEDTEGEKTYTCTICSATKTESIGKTEHKHTLTAHDAVPADCTTKGNEAYWTCSGCNKIFSDENGTREITAIPTIPATGHKFLTEWANNETYHWHAATCGHDVVSDEAVHSWDSGIVTTEPTEEAAGVKTFTCTVCSATRTESVSQIPHTHTYSTEWTSDSTSHWHAATCGHDVTSEAAAHTEDGGTVTVPATTENDGLKTYACSVCGYVMRTVTIPKLGEDHTHNFSPDWKHDSTSHWHECDCGEKNEIAPHVEDGGVVTTEPTETSTGIMTYSCSVCGYVMRTDVIPALVPEHNHTFGTDWKYDSVSHWHECECGEKSDIANHISSDWIVVTPATTDLEGVQIKRCTVCGIELDRETIEKLPNISTGDVAEDVRDTAGTNAGLVQDNTLIENVLTPDDKTEVTEGHSFEIVLEVTDIRDSVPAADVAAASSALRYNEQIGIYVDLSLFKIKDNSERTPIYNTSGRIGITLTIPESIYASDRTYSIIRVHDGIAENLGGTYDKASRELTFYTDKFSTYAIAYAASNGGTDRPSVPDTPTNPSVPTYPNTPVVPVTPTVTETTVKKEEEVISDEPYVEDVSSAAGIYESGETDNNIHYVMILIFAAAAGVAAIAAKKRFGKKNMK